MIAETGNRKPERWGMALAFALAVAGAFAPITPIRDGQLSTTLDANEKNIKNAAYINFGLTEGFSGYGLRDNSGTLEFKNSGGSWAVLGSGGGGGGGGTVTSIGITGTSGITVTDSPVTTSGNITLGIDWATITPGTLSATSTNNATGTTHTHAITASSNPGASSALLKTDGDGLLQLRRLTISDYLRSPNYVSGLTGFNLDAVSGNAEFNNADIRGAIHASVIVYGQVQATAGTILTSKSAAKLRTDVVIPAAPTYGTTTVNIDVVDADGLSHASSQLFSVGDVLYLKDGFVGATWFTVASVSDQTTFWRYVATIRCGTNNVTYRTGLGAADYGGAGAGFIVQTADATNAPYLQMATHDATFTAANSSGTLVVTPQLRLGNLNGWGPISTDTFGFAVGNYAGGSYLTADPTGVSIIGGAGVLTLDANGMSIAAQPAFSSGSAINWKKNDGNAVFQLFGLYNSGTHQAIGEVLAPLPAADSAGESILKLYALNNATTLGGLEIVSRGTTNASNPAKSFARLYDISAGTSFLGLTVGSANPPTHLLDLHGTAWFADKVGIGTSNGATQTYFLTIKGGNDNQLLLDNAGTQYTSQYFANSGAVRGQVVLDNTGNRFIVGGANAGISAVITYGAGTAGITLTSTGSVRFHAYGAGTLTTDASGNITAASDERNKDIAGDFTGGLDDIDGIQPKTGKWKEETGLDRTQSYVWPATAQQLLETYPEAVSLGPDGKYSVDQNVLIAVLVNSVKTLKAKVLALEGKSATPARPKDDRADRRIAELQAAKKKRAEAGEKRGPVVNVPTATPRKKNK